MRFVCLILLSFFFVSRVWTQDSEECQTYIEDSLIYASAPWMSDSLWLERVDAEVTSAIYRMISERSIGSVNSFLYQMPVKLWIYDGSPSEVNSINDEVAERMINDVNNYFLNNGLSLKLYTVCANERKINREFYYGEGQGHVLENDRVSGLLNVHFRYLGGGLAKYPWSTGRYSCVVGSNNNGVGLFNSSVTGSVTLSHEIGHNLGLYHTHEGGDVDNAKRRSSAQEVVSRTERNVFNNLKCKINGDGLCDTSGDPNIYKLVNSGCIYWTNGYTTTDDDYREDANNVVWVPPVSNFMSYAPQKCRSVFSGGQVNIMYYFTKNYQEWGLFERKDFENVRTFYSNPEVDDFENDNFSVNAQEIVLGQRQARSFHRAPTGHNMGPTCDEDWIKFTLTEPTTVVLRTETLAGAAQHGLENTFIELFLADNSTSPRPNGTALAENEDIHPGNKFSELRTTLQPGTYLVHVLNRGPIDRATYYAFTLERCFIRNEAAAVSVVPYPGISYPEGFNGSPVGCSSVPTRFRLSGYTSTDISTTWSVSSLLSIVGTPDAGAVDVLGSATQSGWGTVTATVRGQGSGCGPTALTYSDSIWVGRPVSAGLAIAGRTPIYTNQTTSYYLYTVPTMQGATYYSWTVTNGATIVSGNGTTQANIRFPNRVGTHTISVSGQNGCGSAAVISYVVTVSSSPVNPPTGPCRLPPCARERDPVSIYPNAAQVSTTVSLSDSLITSVNGLEMVIVNVSSGRQAYVAPITGRENNVPVTGWQRGMYSVMIRQRGTGTVVETQPLLLE